MSQRNTVVRSLHDLGLAAWFGGSLAGAVGINGAAADVPDESLRLQVATAGWARWSPVNPSAIGAHLVPVPSACSCANRGPCGGRRRASAPAPSRKGRLSPPQRWVSPPGAALWARSWPSLRAGARRGQHRAGAADVSGRRGRAAPTARDPVADPWPDRRVSPSSTPCTASSSDRVSSSCPGILAKPASAGGQPHVGPAGADRDRRGRRRRAVRAAPGDARGDRPQRPNGPMSRPTARLCGYRLPGDAGGGPWNHTTCTAGSCGTAGC